MLVPVVVAAEAEAKKELVLVAIPTNDTSKTNKGRNMNAFFIVPTVQVEVLELFVIVKCQAVLFVLLLVVVFSLSLLFFGKIQKIQVT